MRWRSSGGRERRGEDGGGGDCGDNIGIDVGVRVDGGGEEDWAGGAFDVVMVVIDD